MWFKDDDGRKSYKQYYLPTVKIKYYNVMIDGRNFFDQPIKNDLKRYDNIRKIVTGQDDDYTTVLNFSKGTVKVLWFYFVLIKY